MEMRKVRFTPRRPDWAGDPDIMRGVRYQHRLTRPVDFGTGRVEPVWSIVKTVNGTSAELDLPVTPTDLSWAVEVYCEMPDGRGGLLKTSEVVQVPAGSYSTVLEFENLTRVDRSSLQPIVTAPSALELRLQAVEAAVGSGVEIGGDLSGAAATPTVAKVRGVAVSATPPSAGQVLVATSPTAAQWQGAASSIAIAGLPPGSIVAVRKDASTGFWPASWDSNGQPVYTGGSASTGVRPTGRGDICVQWIGQAPHPPIVSSGTAGVRDGVDLRTVLP